jgi:hypothetical protein
MFTSPVCGCGSGTESFLQEAKASIAAASVAPRMVFTFFIIVEWYGLIAQYVNTVLHLLRFRHSRKGTGSNAMRCPASCQDRMVSMASGNAIAWL